MIDHDKVQSPLPQENQLRSSLTHVAEVFRRSIRRRGYQTPSETAFLGYVDGDTLPPFAVMDDAFKVLRAVAELDVLRGGPGAELVRPARGLPMAAHVVDDHPSMLGECSYLRFPHGMVHGDAVREHDPVRAIGSADLPGDLHPVASPEPLHGAPSSCVPLRDQRGRPGPKRIGPDPTGLAAIREDPTLEPRRARP